MKTPIFQILAAALAVAVAAGAPASARNRTPRPITPLAPSTAEDLQVLHRFGSCVAGRDAVRAQRLLAMDFRTPDYGSALLRFADSTPICRPPGVLRFSGVLFAGAVAEHLLRSRLEGGDLGARTALDPNLPPIAARDQMEMTGLCVVRAAPAPVAALLATDPAGPEEAAAIGALMPRIQECLAAGVAANLNRPAIRSLLALAAYRLTEHRRRNDAAGAG